MADPQASSRIFISYRREDSSGHVLALLPALRRHFGDRIFKDTDNIPPGEDFIKFIKRELESCSVLLAIIGRDWLSIQDPRLKIRRLDNPDDFLRVEIATALKSDRIRVIPVLVERSTMPSVLDLPPDIAELATRNALELSDGRWDSDVQLLIQAIHRGGAGSSPDVAVQRPELQDVQKRRAREIAAHLSAARDAFDARAFEATLVECEKALLLDPQNTEALELLDQARTNHDRQRVEAWLRQARESLDRGDIARASHFIDQALALDPASDPALALRTQMLAVRRDRERGSERARLVAGAVERARARFEEGEFGSAVRHADDALTFEPSSPEAQSIRSKALSSLEERRRKRDSRVDEGGEVARPSDAAEARPQHRVMTTEARTETAPARRTRSYALPVAVAGLVLAAIAGFAIWQSQQSSRPESSTASIQTSPTSSVVPEPKPEAAPSASPPASAAPATTTVPEQSAVVTPPSKTAAEIAREQKVMRLRDEARDQFQKGQRRALNTVMDGLRIAPDDAELKSILDSLLVDAQRFTRRAREAAVTAGAPQHARPTHQAALKLEQEAAAQTAAGRTDTAIRTFWRAEELFDRAERDARVELAHLEQQRKTQAASKQTGARPTDAPASKLPAPGNIKLSGSATAATPGTTGTRPASDPARAPNPSPAPAAPAAPAPPPSSPALDLEKSRIAATVQRYAVAYTALNAGGVNQVFPTDPTWQFTEFEYYTLRLDDLVVDLASPDAVTATVACNATHLFKRKQGAHQTERIRQTFTLRKRGAGWIIASATFDRTRR